MAKSNRRRRLDRAKRHARDSQQQAAARRRQESRQWIQDTVGRLRQLVDPGTSAADLAGLFNEVYRDAPVPASIVSQLKGFGWSVERLTELADFMLGSGDADGREPSLTALTFAAQVAQATDKVARARELLDRALAASATGDSRARWILSDHLWVSGRLADAIILLEASLREAPDDDFVAESYGAAISEAYLRVNGQPPAGGCSCGLEAAWEECCGPRERAALDRFTDRSGLIALTDAVNVFLSGSEHGRSIDDRVAQMQADYDDLDWETGDLASFGALLAERALSSAKPTQADLGDEDDEEEDEAASPIGAFAADPSVPGELAARADAWRSHIRYGLWKVDISPPAPGPGLWCTDLCTGVVRHAEFPARFTDGWPRWSVWLGGIVPVDGIWRATGTGLRLSPTEADAAAEYVESAVIRIVHTLAGNKQPPRPYNYLRIGEAEPLGVLIEQQDPLSSDLASITRIVVGELLPRLVGEVHRHRLANPASRKADEDGLITVVIAVNDCEQVSDRLAVRPGFERDPDNPDLITWYAIRIPDQEDPAAPQRWLRGTLEVDGGQIVAAVSSAECLDRLLEVLSKIGADPVVIKEQLIDPAEDPGWPDGERARPTGSALPGEGGEKYWLDEQLPALLGQTPRQAAAGEERERIEAVLRQFAYEADLLVAQGLPGIDTDWLRQELAMHDASLDES